MDVDILGPTCKLLHSYDRALEIIALHTRICDLIFYSLLFLEEYDCEIVGSCGFFLLFFFSSYETAGDPQTAVSHLGDVVLFVQYALAKFKVSLFCLPTTQFNHNSIEIMSSNVDHHHARPIVIL